MNNWVHGSGSRGTVSQLFTSHHQTRRRYCWDVNYYSFFGWLIMNEDLVYWVYFLDHSNSMTKKQP